MSNKEQNLHAKDDASQLFSLMCNYIADDAKHLSNSMWTGRTLTFVKAFVPVMVALRDAQATDLLPTSLLTYMSLEKLANVAFNHQDQYGEDFEAVCQPLVKYIQSLPGFNAENPLSQSQMSIQQHGFVAMTITRVIGELVVFGTSTFKTDFLGMDLTALMLAYNESLVVKADLDNTLFSDANHEEDKVFTQNAANDDVDDENNLFSHHQEDSIFAKSDDPDDEIMANIIDIFDKVPEPELLDQLVDVDVIISKAS